MATSFSATKISDARLGPDIKVAAYVVQLPSSWTLAGIAFDLSADFDHVYGAVFGVSGAVTDHGNVYDLIGTVVASTTGDGQGGVAASGLSLVAHRDAATEVVFPGVPNSTDLSAVNDLTMLVFGS
jgi:hypothetical protein